MMYKVEFWHTKPTYRKGDLEDTTEYTTIQFSKRKDAKSFIESKLRGLPDVRRDYHTGNIPSHCVGFTNKKWVNENSGETCYECLRFKLTKI